MKITIKIDMINAAFADGQSGREVASILNKLAGQLTDCNLDGGVDIALFDSNGNKVGHAKSSKGTHFIGTPA